MTDLLTKAAHDTARMDTHQVVAYLLERLGPTTVAYIAGSKSRAMPARWATAPTDPGHAQPSEEKTRRLKAAHTVFRSIEDAENDQVARNWLLSANPRLDGLTPAQSVREDRVPASFARRRPSSPTPTTPEAFLPFRGQVGVCLYSRRIAEQEGAGTGW